LEGASGGQPKILLEVGGKSLLEWHLTRLAESGIRRLTLVTGFERDKVRAALRGMEGRYPVGVDLKVNERFTEGSALSFEASIPVLESMREAVLLMDADVLYPAALLRR
jgi:choline kinase